MQHVLFNKDKKLLSDRNL